MLSETTSVLEVLYRATCTVALDIQTYLYLYSSILLTRLFIESDGSRYNIRFQVCRRRLSYLYDSHCYKVYEMLLGAVPGTSTSTRSMYSMSSDKNCTLYSIYNRFLLGRLYVTCRITHHTYFLFDVYTFPESRLW